MTDDRLAAVRRVREEADNLRLACIAVANGTALLHVAYDQAFEAVPTLEQAVLLGRLASVPR